MKLFVALTLVAWAGAAKLDSNYLPPNAAQLSGGNGQILAAPSGNVNSGLKSAEGGAAILRFDNENSGDGSYQFAFETENRIQQQEQGQLKNAGSEQESIEVRGSYSYVGPDGQTITVNYVADENGFQPTGDHLPTPPPIPDAILRSIEINAAAEDQQPSDQQSGGYKY